MAGAGAAEEKWVSISVRRWESAKAQGITSTNPKKGTAQLRSVVSTVAAPRWRNESKTICWYSAAPRRFIRRDTESAALSSRSKSKGEAASITQRSSWTPTTINNTSTQARA